LIERTNPITPAGFAAMQAEYHQLMSIDRPAIVDVVSWAAGNGDRSENGDYIYGRQKLRDIDRRAGFLARRMKAAQVIDPAAQENRGRVWFGATVTIADPDDKERVVTLTGDDESDAGAGQIGWSSPIARALRGAAVGDVKRVTLPGGEVEYEVVSISYPNAALASASTSGSASTGFMSTPASNRSAT
jgi:transcription elongation factor GreB